MFARDGYPFILGAAALVVVAFAMALRFRSWPLWLGAIALTVIALSVAWFYRNPTRVGERASSVASAPVNVKLPLRTIDKASALPQNPTIGSTTVVMCRISGQRVIAGLHIS